MFLEEVEKVSKIFKSLIKEKHVKVVSHLDADGLTSASMIVKTLLMENVNFELRIIKQLTKEFIENFNFSERDFIILTDLGSGQLEQLKNILEKTQVLIIDHHDTKHFDCPNLFHLNPLIFKEEEISSSMICYLFSKNVNLRNTDLIDLAVVGAVGDELDEKWKFGGLGRKIIEEAETIGKISVSRGLRLYGRNTRPIHKILEYSFDPFVPGISGSESNAIQLLSELKIPVKEKGEWRRLKDLTVEEQQRLASAIIIERLRSKHSDAADIFGEIYTVSGRPEEIQDTREFATILNACGRLGRHEAGIKLCLGDLKAVEESWYILNEYRRLINEIINWIRTENIISTTEFANYVFCEEKVPDTMIGTIISIALNSNLLDTDKPVFGFAESGSGKIKVSARASRDLKINLRDIIFNASKAVEGEGGGHRFASGALIPKEKKGEFVKAVDAAIGELIG